MANIPAEQTASDASPDDRFDLLPLSLRDLGDHQRAIPAIARDPAMMQSVRQAASSVPTFHELFNADARYMSFLEPGSVHLVLTSPPYWTLKEYREGEGQLGYVADYEEFLDSLDMVWRACFDALVPGGRLICVVGDVCLSRRKNAGRHVVVPLHASIQERCRAIGFDNLAPIIWNKIANAQYEVAGGGGFLGKPYEPNAVIKNDIEYILMQRKSGGYRKPTLTDRILSVISDVEHKKWFQQVWTDVVGASTRNHPAPYPVQLAERLVRMFSFVGDTVLDPFLGTGTTSVASANAGRNSIGVEVDPVYFASAFDRVRQETAGLFSCVDVAVGQAEEES